MEIDLESLECESVDVPIEMDNAISQEGTLEFGEKKWKKTSNVWKFFTELPLGSDKIPKAKCNRCGSVYNSVAKNGTGSLLKHLQGCLANVNHDVSQMLLNRQSGGLVLGGGKFNAAKFRELVVSALIMHDLPFSFVEYEGIRDIFRYLHPDIQLMSRNTAKSDAVKLYKKEKSRIKNLLEDAPGRVSFTFDA